MLMASLAKLNSVSIRQRSWKRNSLSKILLTGQTSSPLEVPWVVKSFQDSSNSNLQGRKAKVHRLLEHPIQAMRPSRHSLARESLLEVQEFQQLATLVQGLPLTRDLQQLQLPAENKGQETWLLNLSWLKTVVRTKKSKIWMTLSQVRS